MPDLDDGISEEIIRRRSYQIWEREDRPAGKHLDHWFRAKAELRAELRRHIQDGEIPVGGNFVYFWNHFG